MDTLRSKMSALTPYAKKHKVTVVGSGNWGSTIAKVVAENTAAFPDIFETEVQMWVYEETVEVNKGSKHYNASSELSQGPQKLTRLINELHENVKYLPNIPLPKNVVANPSITDSVKDSTILIFNLPHQFIVNLCKQLQGHILPYARGISCIKGVNVQESSISLFSETIGQELGIYCGALSGANIANEVAQEKFSETTIAYDPPAMDSQAATPATSAGPSPASSHVDLTKLVHKDVSGKTSKVKLKPLPTEYRPIDHELLKKLFHRRYFHVRVVGDVAGVSLGGALKNIVAVAAGWVDGLGWGDNAKAAVMRVGLLEMVDFGKRFFAKTVKTPTFTEESAGVADLITTCAGGRNHRCAKMSIIEGKPIEEIEARELNGQKLQGTLTAYEVNAFLKSQGLEKEYPLFTAVYNILKGKAKVEDLPDLIEPEDEYVCEQGMDILTHETSVAAPKIVSDPPSDQTQKSPACPSISNSMIIPKPALTSSRYNRHVLIPSISLQGQASLLRAKVLVVGLGGLGSPAALYLAGAGIHTLGLLDDDVVELSNLHRQVVHREDSVKNGLSKVASAVRGCKELNSETNYVAHETRLTSENALKIMEKYDIVLDCTDNPAARYLINDACVLLGKILISGAAQKIEGQLMVLNQPGVAGAEKGPCYRCVFPRAPSPEMVKRCGDVGILSTVVGTIGILMAGEAIRLIVQGEKDGWRKPNLLLYNAWSADPKHVFRSIGLRGRRKDCVVCGDENVLKEKSLERITKESLTQGRMDYEAFCGVSEDLKLLGPENRVDAMEFIEQIQNSGENPTIVDVREANEVEIGAKVQGSINIPITKILREGSLAFDQLQEDLDPSLSRNGDTKPRPVYFICKRGNDSQTAAQKLMEMDLANGQSNRWIGDVRGGFIEMEKL